MSRYDIVTLGALGELPNLSRDWPNIPPGWVPAGTPGLPGRPAPVPGPPVSDVRATASVNAPAIAALAIGGVLVGALGLWAWGRF